MDESGNVVIENKEIENERLALTDKTEFYFLGPNLTLRHCTLVTKVSGRQLSLDRVNFSNCSLEVKQQLTNFQDWIRTSLKGCRFKGRFSGNDFGHWPEYGSQPEYQFGAIEDCDFSEALLDTCRFHGDDPRTLRFPSWPCFTFLEPLRHLSELQSVKWPSLFGDVVIARMRKHPASTMALTYHAPSTAKRFETTEEELKAVIRQFDCIVY